jgi:hypothetical protein
LEGLIMAIHTHTVSAYVESELPEGMTLGAYRVRKLNREARLTERASLPMSVHGEHCACHHCARFELVQGEVIL